MKGTSVQYHCCQKRESCRLLSILCWGCQARALEAGTAIEWQMAVVEQQMLRAALFTRSRRIYRASCFRGQTWFEMWQHIRRPDGSAFSNYRTRTIESLGRVRSIENNAFEEWNFSCNLAFRLGIIPQWKWTSNSFAFRRLRAKQQDFTSSQGRTGYFTPLCPIQC